MSEKESTQSSPEEQEQQNKVDWVIPDEGVRDAYCDWYHLNWLPLNVRVRFGQIVADPRVSPQDARWVINEQAAITMPWATAKSVNEMLTRLIVAYEKQNGEITVPTIPSLE
jgi:hypothetical protein